MKKLFRLLKISAFVVTLAGVSGCAAIGTAVAHKDLVVQTRMSSTIFLTPVAPADRTVFVDIHNTSAKAINIKPQVIAAVESSGYKVIDNPTTAHYWLQVNVLQVGEANPTAAKEALDGGYGSSMQGILTGAVAGGLLTGRAGGALVGGVIGGVANTVGNNMVHDVTYTMITDIQVAEIAPEILRSTVTTSTEKGNAGSAGLNGGKVDLTKQTVSKNVTTGEQDYAGKHRRFYRTRIVSTANKVNLPFDQALPSLENGLAQSVAGIF